MGVDWPICCRTGSGPSNGAASHNRSFAQHLPNGCNDGWQPASADPIQIYFATWTEPSGAITRTLLPFDATRKGHHPLGHLTPDRDLIRNLFPETDFEGGGVEISKRVPGSKESSVISSVRVG
jgi:hypothetical protein